MVEVVNLKTCKDWGKPGDIKIDRTTKWGNPFLIGKDGDRDDVCNKYALYIRKQLQSGNLNINELQHAKRLGCWCKPLRCHGDELKKILDSKSIKTLNDYTGMIKMNNVEYIKYITRYDVKTHKNKIFVFGDNDQRTGLGGQAREMRGEPNAIGIRVKKSPAMNEDSFYNDDEYASNIQKIDQDLDHLSRTSHNKIIVFPSDGIGTGLAMLNQNAPKTFDYLTMRLNQIFNITNGDPNHHYKIHAQALKLPTHKIKPIEKFEIGDMIRFGYGDLKLTGTISDIYNKNTIREKYMINLSDDPGNRIILKLSPSDKLKPVIINKEMPKEKLLQLRKRTIKRTRILRKKPIKRCVCKKKQIIKKYKRKLK